MHALGRVCVCVRTCILANAVDRTDAAMEVKDPVPGGVNGMMAGSDLYIVHNQRSLTSLAVSE